MHADGNERIKRRIRALLNLASDDAAATGEIENAMRMASDLMNEHHISQEDIAAEAAANNAPPPTPDMGTSDAACGTKRLSTWESLLAWAVVELVGSVKHHCTTVQTPIAGGSVFESRTETRAGLRFYGPAEDATLAAELFDEWRGVISAMAVGRFGGCWRGDGAMYAYGFSCELYKRAKHEARARATIPATSNAIVLATGKTLAQALEQKRKLASAWLADQGVTLSKRGCGHGGYTSGDRSALEAGRSDGARADFSANRRRKLSASS